LLALLYAATDREGAFTIPDDLAEYLGWPPSRLIAAHVCGSKLITVGPKIAAFAKTYTEEEMRQIYAELRDTAVMFKDEPIDGGRPTTPPLTRWSLPSIMRFSRVFGSIPSFCALSHARCARNSSFGAPIGVSTPVCGPNKSH
jgi:hypothetical protein